MKRLYRINDLSLENLLASKYKENYIKKHLWKYDYFMTEILNKNCNEDFVKLNHDSLEFILGRIKINGKVNRAYEIIRNDLEFFGIIKKPRIKFISRIHK